MTRAKSILRRMAIAVAALAVLALGVVVAPTGAAAQQWKFYTYNPSAAHPNTVAIQDMLKEIEQKTGGKMAMRLSLGGSLTISSTDITQAVADNIVQIADDGFFTGNIPIGGVLRLPMLINSREEFIKAMGVMEPYLRDALAKQGVTLLATYLYPEQSAWSSKELRKLEDIKGQKLRVTAPEMGVLVERLGGIPVTIGAPEVAPSLQRGVVDGVFTASAGGGQIWNEMLKYNYRIKASYFDSLIIANTEAFERLPKEQQDIIRTAAKKVADRMTAEMKDREATITKELAGEGMIVTEPTPEETQRAIAKMEDYWPEWAAGVGPEAEEALSEVRAVLAQ